MGAAAADHAEVLALKTDPRRRGHRAPPGFRGPEFALVHRPRYDDWTFPKGKAEPGEADEDNAEREVREETGLRCERGPEVATIAYDDHAGRPKTVRYWLMYPAGGAFAPNDEVDQLRWVDASTAAAMLTYDHDRRVLESALAFDRPVVLVRHAKAGDRDRWHEDDGYVRSRARANCRPRRSWVCSPTRPSTGCCPVRGPVRADRSPAPLERSVPIEEHDALAEGASVRDALVTRARHRGCPSWRAATVT